MFLKNTSPPYFEVIVGELINHDVEFPGQWKTGIRFWKVPNTKSVWNTMMTGGDPIEKCNELVKETPQ